MNNIRQIGLSLIQYAGDNNDKFPPTLGTLPEKHYLTTTKVFTCPSAGRCRFPEAFVRAYAKGEMVDFKKVEEYGDYAIVKGITHAADANAVVVYEKDGAHGGEGRNVFFNDGNVKWYTEADFQQLMREQVNLPK